MMIGSIVHACQTSPCLVVLDGVCVGHTVNGFGFDEQGLMFEYRSLFRLASADAIATHLGVENGVSRRIDSRAWTDTKIGSLLIKPLNETFETTSHFDSIESRDAYCDLRCINLPDFDLFEFKFWGSRFDVAAYWLRRQLT